jgi:pilus assembly protein Flp/PilA
MLEQLKRLVKDEEAPTAVEYALMVAAIAVVALVGAKLLGSATSKKFEDVSVEVAK